MRFLIDSRFVVLGHLHSVHSLLLILLLTQMRVRDAITKAEQYIENESEEGTEFCNYGLALSAYALHKSVASRNKAARDSLISALHSRITSSKACEW